MYRILNGTGELARVQRTLFDLSTSAEGDVSRLIVDNNNLRAALVKLQEERGNCSIKLARWISCC